jgi:hypothetical protein
MNWSNLFDDLKAYDKLLDSLLKSSWDYKDYPIKVWKAPNVRDKKFIWQAKIIHWTIMHQAGSTKKEALNNLRAYFQSYKASNENLPRPGTKVALDVKFAKTEEIDKYREISKDFIAKILNANKIQPLFISDISSLTVYEPQDEYKAKAQRDEIIKNTFIIYGIDISENYDGPIYKIFEMINNKNLQN